MISSFAIRGDSPVTEMTVRCCGGAAARLATGGAEGEGRAGAARAAAAALTAAAPTEAAPLLLPAVV